MGSLRLFYAICAAAATSAAAFTPPNLAPPSPSVRRGRNSGDKSVLWSGAIDEFDDFADFSSTQLAPSEEKNGGGVAGDDDPFLSSLQSRLKQVQERSDKLPLMILDTMLPRQVLQIQIQHPTLKSLMRRRVAMETPTLGMLGTARISTGQTVPLKAGVEVEIVEIDKVAAGGDGGGERPWDVSLRAGRRFVIEGDVERMEGGWTEARVKFLDSSAEEEGEVRRFATEPCSAAGDNRLSVARAISKSRVFTEPNMKMKDNASLVDRWIELARQNERHPGQVDALLRQLGEIPPEHEPTERALWVGALINPLPSMGVAKEIRPALLLSKRAEERVEVALDGILRSIRHMDGTSRMW